MGVVDDLLNNETVLLLNLSKLRLTDFRQLSRWPRRLIITPSSAQFYRITGVSKDHQTDRQSCCGLTLFSDYFCAMVDCTSQTWFSHC